MPSELVRANLSEQLAASLLNAILDKQFSPGSLLPSEAELAVRFRVSRPVIREAVRVLATRGLVRPEQGRGVVVLEPNGRVMLDHLVLSGVWRQVPIKGLWETRQVLEVAIAGLAAERRTEADLADMVSALASMRQSVELGAEENVLADVEFHRALRDGAHNDFLALVMEPIAQLFRIVLRAFVARGAGRVGAPRGPESAEEWPAWSYRSHVRLFERIQAGDAAGARDEVRDHIVASSWRWQAQLELTLDELVDSWPLGGFDDGDTPTGPRGEVGNV